MTKQKRPKNIRAETDELYRLDMEISLKGSGIGAPITGWSWAEGRYIGDETMCRALMDNWKIAGLGGRLVRLDGTPDGEIIEQWSSIGRLEWAKAQELANQKKS